MHTNAHGMSCLPWVLFCTDAEASTYFGALFIGTGVRERASPTDPLWRSYTGILPRTILSTVLGSREDAWRSTSGRCCS